MKILSSIGGLIWKVWLLNIILTIKYVVFMYDRYIRATTLTTSMYPCVSWSSSFANFVNSHGNCISPLVTINLIKYARLGGHSQFVSDPLARIFSHCSNFESSESASQEMSLFSILKYYLTSEEFWFAVFIFYKSSKSVFRVDFFFAKL